MALSLVLLLGGLKLPNIWKQFWNEEVIELTKTEGS